MKARQIAIALGAVTRGAVTPIVEAVGSIAYNERDVAVVQARGNGFVEKLYVRAPLDPVRKGQPLAELYVPDWVAAQEEYLSARRFAGTRMESLVDGARQRMRLAGMSEAQIQQVESTGKVQARLVTYAPIDGVVAELSAREGMTVMSGAPLYQLNRLRTLLVKPIVPVNDVDRMDAERSLRASEARMADGPSAAESSKPAEQKPAAAGDAHRGTGKVLSLDAASGHVELAHDPIASLQWPAMSMGFQAEDKGQLASIKPGDRVEFELNPKPNKDGDFTLRSIRRGGGK